MSYISNHGYLRNGLKYVHRETMEAFLQRKLLRSEHVHHKNGDKLDNRLENLEVLSETDHHKLHWKGKSLDREKLRRLVEAGYTFPQIAKTMNRPYSTVQVAAREMGLAYQHSQKTRQEKRRCVCLWCKQSYIKDYNNAGKYCSRTCMWVHRRS